MSEPSYVADIMVETLKRTAHNTPINLSDIVASARTTSQVVQDVLTELTGLEISSGTILSSSDRFRIALKAAGLGSLERAARALTWQEFEKFSDECLANAGFETQKGLIFSGDGRRWQVDIIGVKNQILLAVDCKHWESPNYSSKFDRAVEHQNQCLRPLIRHMRSKGRLTDQEVWALPVIITLFEPRESFLENVVLLSVRKLQSFLEHLTPFSSELPFISDKVSAESSIS